MKKNWKRLVLVLTMVLGLALGLVLGLNRLSVVSKADETTTTVELTVIYEQTEARSMLGMINDFRTGDDAWYWNEDDTTKTECTDLSELTYDYDLEAIAMQRAAEIALYYSHTRPNGDDCFSIYEEDGFTYGYYAVGENIAAGFMSAEAAFEAWQETDANYSGQGHRRNMLSSDFTAVGISCVVCNGSLYWVQVFAKPQTEHTTYTEETNGTANVTIEVLNSYISSVSLEVDSTTYSDLTCGETSDLPVLIAYLSLDGTWPSDIPRGVIVNSPSWSSSDTEVATVSGSNVTAVTAGTTTLTASAFSQSVSVSVTVNHNYIETVTPPTCTEEGYTTYKCTGCDKSHIENVTEALGHNYTSEVTKAATCTEDGLMTYICSVCGDSYTETVSATGHVYGDAIFTWVEGYSTATASFICGNCGDVVKVNAEVTSMTLKPTCTSAGETVYTATAAFNGQIYTDEQTESIDATGHSYDSVVTAPTCTEKGYTTYICTVCGYKYTENEVSATGHNYASEVTTAATCTEAGAILYTCTACGDTYTETIPATGHSYDAGVVTTEATCTEPGVKTYTCASCGDTYTEVIPATGHSYGSTVTAPTCTEKGYTTYTCSVCGNSYTADETDALGHSWDEGVITKEATEEEDGLRTYTCTVCGETRTETIPAITHTYGEPLFTWAEDYSSAAATFTCEDEDCDRTITETAEVTTKTTQPTCTETGVTVYTAMVTFNGEIYTDTKTVTFSATGHNYESIVTAPTCTEDGYTTYTCAVCGDTYTAEETNATGHSYGEGVIIKEVTCTEDGETVYTCSACGDTYTETISATGHNYDDGVITITPLCNRSGEKTYTCENCGDTYTEVIPTAPHTMADGVVIKEATCTEDGKMTCICAICNSIYTEAIPATGHSYTEVVTEPTCTEKGYTTYTCTVCGDSYTADETEALGHTWDSGAVTKAATETEDGVMTYTCTVCGETCTESIPATGSTEDNTGDDNTEEEDTTENNTTAEDTADTTAGTATEAASEPVAVESAATGDDSPAEAMAVTLLLAAVGIAALTLMKKRTAC